MQNPILLKHLDQITAQKPDFAKLMVELLGFKPSIFMRTRLFQRAFLRIYKIVEEAKRIDPGKCKQNPTSLIKPPNNADELTFAAVMLIQTLNNNEGSTSDFIGEFLAAACFSANSQKDFNQSSFEYAVFKNRILSQPLADMLGLYNDVTKMLDESQKSWEKRFLEVSSEDADYIDAGGQTLSTFNVICTIRDVCKDFNVDYEKAWLLQYGVVQTNSLQKATASKVQERMSKIKEARFKAQRGG